MKQKIIIISFLSLLCSFAAGQEKIYYDEQGNSVKDISSAVMYSTTERVASGIDSIITETSYYMSGQKKEVHSYLHKYTKKGKLIAEKDTGERCEWFENGDKRLKAFYQDGKKEGEFCSWWPNGKNRRKDIFEKDKLIEGNCFDTLGNKLPDYFPYETFPQFPGGDMKLKQYLDREVKYPPKALEKNIQGKVVTHFCVEVDGSISNIRVIKHANFHLDLEAYRVISNMPDWIPATQEGQKVRVKFFLPISFVLQTESVSHRQTY